MVERLPKDCTSILDSFAKALSKDARFGVEVSCTANGKNKFKLKVEFCSPYKLYFVNINYNNVTIPAIGKLFNAVYPDFLLKKTSFMPLDKLVDHFKIDKAMLAFEVMKSLKATFKTAMKRYYAKEGVCITLSTSLFYGRSYKEDNLLATPKFKSFSEFLVWVDLNVK